MSYCSDGAAGVRYEWEQEDDSPLLTLSLEHIQHTYHNALFHITHQYVISEEK